MIGRNKHKKLNSTQKGIIECLKKTGIYFIPFTIDGIWNFAEDIKVLDINELTSTLKKNNKWNVEVSLCDMDYPVYMLEIYLLNDTIKKEILKPFRKFEDHYLHTEIESNITLYLRYSDMLLIYNADIIQSDRWKDIL